MTAKQTSVKVSIFGNEYGIKGEADPGYIREIAGLVDEKMNEVSEIMDIPSHAKVAVLAALNIADELYKARESGPSSGSNDDGRIIRLIDLIEETLSSD
ncbi:cell division protein ZapA [candidate division KSB1 bacterium]